MPDSVDSPAPLRMTTSPSATRSTRTPNDPVVLASASWVTIPWCLMPRATRTAPGPQATLGRGRGYRLNQRGRGLLVEQDRVVVHVRHHARPELRNALAPRRDDLGRQQTRRRAEHPVRRGQQRGRGGQPGQGVNEYLLRQHLAAVGADRVLGGA